MADTENNKEVIKHSVWYKKIPTMLTIANSLCGFSAILYCLKGYEQRNNPSELSTIFSHCAWLIVFAMVFDALDGWSARKLKATSLHGVQMDSLSDMVTFGVAPAVVVAVNAHLTGMQYSPERRYDHFVWAACAIYMACAACRLALYNVHAVEEKKDDNFSGLPSPGAAAGIVSILLASEVIPGDWLITFFLPAFTAFLGFLMVADITYPHLGKWLVSPKKRARKLIVIAIAIAALCLQPTLSLASFITIYICSGPLLTVARSISGKKISEEDELEDLL